MEVLRALLVAVACVTFPYAWGWAACRLFELLDLERRLPRPVEPTHSSEADNAGTADVRASAGDKASNPDSQS